MSALLLITIVMMVAATMAGVFTVNINITNRVANSSVALSEAEMRTLTDMSERAPAYY